MVIYFIMLYARSAINHRKYPRHTVLKEGKIVSSTMNDAINVTIRDLSVGGAQIKLPSYIGLPQEFSLLVSSENLLYPAEAKWRTGEATGIAFIGEPFRGSVLRYINAPGGIGEWEPEIKTPATDSNPGSGKLGAKNGNPEWASAASAKYPPRLETITANAWPTFAEQAPASQAVFLCR